MKALKLLVVLMLMVLALQVVVAEPVAYIQFNCYWTATSIDCGQTATAKCDVVSKMYDGSLSTLDVTSVKVTISNKDYEMSLASGTHVNGTWSASIPVSAGMENPLEIEDVAIVEESGGSCYATQTVTSPPGCKWDISDVADLRITNNCQCTYTDILGDLLPSNRRQHQRVPSAGCEDRTNTTFYTWEDYCDPQWTPQYSACEGAWDSIDSATGTMHKTYVSNNPGCCAATQDYAGDTDFNHGGGSDCTPPPDDYAFSRATFQCQGTVWPKYQDTVNAAGGDDRQKSLKYGNLTEYARNEHQPGLQPLVFDVDRDGEEEIVQLDKSSKTVDILDINMQLENSIVYSGLATSASQPALSGVDDVGGSHSDLGYTIDLGIMNGEGPKIVVPYEVGSTGWVKIFNVTSNGVVLHKYVNVGAPISGTACYRGYCYFMDGDGYLYKVNALTGGLSTGPYYFPVKVQGSWYSIASGYQLERKMVPTFYTTSTGSLRVVWWWRETSFVVGNYSKTLWTGVVTDDNLNPLVSFSLRPTHITAGFQEDPAGTYTWNPTVTPDRHVVFTLAAKDNQTGSAYFDIASFVPDESASTQMDVGARHLWEGSSSSGDCLTNPVSVSNSVVGMQYNVRSSDTSQVVAGRLYELANKSLIPNPTGNSVEWLTCYGNGACSVIVDRGLYKYNGYGWDFVAPAYPTGATLFGMSYRVANEVFVFYKNGSNSYSRIISLSGSYVDKLIGSNPSGYGRLTFFSDKGVMYAQYHQDHTVNGYNIPDGVLKYNGVSWVVDGFLSDAAQSLKLNLFGAVGNEKFILGTYGSDGARAYFYDGASWVLVHGTCPHDFYGPFMDSNGNVYWVMSDTSYLTNHIMFLMYEPGRGVGRVYVDLPGGTCSGSCGFNRIVSFDASRAEMQFVGQRWGVGTPSDWYTEVFSLTGLAYNFSGGWDDDSIDFKLIGVSASAFFKRYTLSELPNIPAMTYYGSSIWKFEPEGSVGSDYGRSLYYNVQDNAVAQSTAVPTNSMCGPITKSDVDDDGNPELLNVGGIANPAKYKWEETLSSQRVFNPGSWVLPIDLDGNYITDLVTSRNDTGILKTGISRVGAETVSTGYNISLYSFRCVTRNNSNVVSVQITGASSNPEDTYVELHYNEETHEYSRLDGPTYDLIFDAPGTYTISGWLRMKYPEVVDSHKLSCTVDIQQSAVGLKVCSLGDDGEFAYSVPLNQHNWYGSGAAATPSGGTVSLAGGTTATYDVPGCTDGVTRVTERIKPELGSRFEVLDKNGNVITGYLFGADNVLYSADGKNIGSWQANTWYIMEVDIDPSTSLVSILKDGISLYSLNGSAVVGGVRMVESGTVDYVRVEGVGLPDGEGGIVGDVNGDGIVDEREQKFSGRGDVSILSNCNASIRDSSDMTQRMSYPALAQYCNTVPGGICTYTDLGRVVKLNPDCYKEAMNYCVHVTFPSTKEGGVTSKSSVVEGGTMCAMNLGTASTFEKVVVPTSGVFWDVLTSNWKPVLIISFVFVLVGFLMLRKK